MPRAGIESSAFSPDTLDFIALLHQHRVRYLIVGGEAVIYYGHARLTGDVDFFYEASATNAHALYRALQDFWQGRIPGVRREQELAEPGLILQFGVPPNRIDLVNRIDGVSFPAAWPRRKTAMIRRTRADLPVHYLSLSDLIKNKKAAGRRKDLEDLEYLKLALKARAARRRRRHRAA